MKKKKKNNVPEKENNEQFIYEGTIVDPIKDIMFHVHLDNSDKIVLGYLSGKIRKNRIRVLLGDRVKILINESDSEKGRIFYRFPPQSKKSLRRLKKIEKRMEKEKKIEKKMEKKVEKNTTSTKWTKDKNRDQNNNSKDTTPNQD